MADQNLNGGTLTAGSVVSAGGVAGMTGQILPTQSATPSAPTAGNSDLYAAAGPGRGLPAWLGEVGAARILQTALFGKTWCEIVASATSIPSIIGNGPTQTTVGTGTLAVVSANGYLQNIVSAASANAQASVRSTAIFRRGTVGDLYGGMFHAARFYLPDASYNNTGASTGTRVQVGLAGNPATTLGSDHGGTAAVSAMFSRDSVNGGAVDTNWQFVTCSGTAATVTDTGLAFAAQHLYESRIFIPLGSTTAVYWELTDLTTDTKVSGTNTTNLFGATATISTFVGLSTIDAVARNIQYRAVYGESDKG